MYNISHICLKQNEYSLLSRGVDLEVADVCQRENIGLTPWCPLKGWVLKYNLHCESILMS